MRETIERKGCQCIMLTAQHVLNTVDSAAEAQGQARCLSCREYSMTNSLRTLMACV